MVSFVDILLHFAQQCSKRRHIVHIAQCNFKYGHMSHIAQYKTICQRMVHIAQYDFTVDVWFLLRILTQYVETCDLYCTMWFHMSTYGLLIQLVILFHTLPCDLYCTMWFHMTICDLFKFTRHKNGTSRPLQKALSNI